MEPSLVGRSEELRLVADLLADPERGGLVLAGPGGVGKTRLACECLRLGEASGLRTARLTATRAAADVPLGAFAPVLDDLPTAAAALLVTARARLRDFAGGSRWLLLVDDVHLLDPVSAALTLQLAADRIAFVVATLRTGEPVPDAVTALWKDGWVERIPIAPLGASDIDALAEAWAGGTLDAATGATFRRLAAGNPLALRELVGGAQTTGRLVADGAVLRLAGAPPVTDRLLELVADRIDRLDDEARTGLELLALGEPLLLEELASRCQALDELDALHLVDVRPGPGGPACWLAHPLHGEVVRSALTPLRRRAHVQQLADLLAARPARSPSDEIRLARWWLELGEHAETEVFRRAAARSLVAGDLAGATDLAAPGWAEGDAASGFVLGSALLHLGRHDEAHEVLGEVVQLAGEEELTAQAAIGRAEAAQRLGDPVAAEAGSLAVEASITGTARLVVAAHRAWLLLGQARLPEALTLAADVLERDEPRAIVVAGMAAALGEVWAGRPEDAIRTVDRVRAVHAGLWDSGLLATDPGSVDMMELWARVQAGELGPAATRFEEAYDRLAATGSSSAVAGLAWELGYAWEELGRPRTAAAWYERALAHYRQLGALQWARWPLAGFIRVATQLGEVPRAAAAAAEIELLRSPGTQNALADELVALAWLRRGEGDPDAARATLDEAVAWAAEREGWASVVLAVHTRARLGLGSADVDLDALAGRVQGERLAAKVAHLEALRGVDANALEGVAARFEGIGAALYAAEAWADAARAWRRHGDPRRATAASARSSAAVAVCEGAVTPPLVLVEAVVPLSDREREVSALAADGLTSKEIAQRLHLSARTVQNHLNRSYEKLGVTGRRALRDALRGG